MHYWPQLYSTSFCYFFYFKWKRNLHSHSNQPTLAYSPIISHRYYMTRSSEAVLVKCLIVQNWAIIYVIAKNEIHLLEEIYVTLWLFFLICRKTWLIPANYVVWLCLTLPLFHVVFFLFDYVETNINLFSLSLFNITPRLKTSFLLCKIGFEDNPYFYWQWYFDTHQPLATNHILLCCCAVVEFMVLPQVSWCTQEDPC